MRRVTSAKLRGACCRVYPVLLVLCYLEVLLWTSCLLLSCAPVSASEFSDSQAYLQREKGNLGLAASSGSALAVPKALHPPELLRVRAVLAHHIKAEAAAASRLHQDALVLVNTDLLQPPLTSLRIAAEESCTGLVAPYAGIDGRSKTRRQNSLLPAAVASARPSLERAT